MVEFSFEQTNQANKVVTRGTYDAGKFKNVMKCVLKEWSDEVRFYKITRDSIYELDRNGNLLKLEECCRGLDNMEACPCESAYLSW